MSTSSSASNSSVEIPPLNLSFSGLISKGTYETPLTSCPDSPKSHADDYFLAGSKIPSLVLDDQPSYPKVNNVCFVGAGFVGMYFHQLSCGIERFHTTQLLTYPPGGPTAALVAYHNPQMIVNVVDLSQEKVAAWSSSHLPIHENGLPKIVRIARDGTNAAMIDLPGLGTISIPKRTPNLTFSTRVTESIAEADIVFICVNTPTKLYGLGAGATADLSIFESATGMIAKHAKDGAIIVEKSTVPCGTAHMIRDIVSPSLPRHRYSRFDLVVTIHLLTPLLARLLPPQRPVPNPKQPRVPCRRLCRRQSHASRSHPHRQLNNTRRHQSGRHTKGRIRCVGSRRPHPDGQHLVIRTHKVSSKRYAGPAHLQHQRSLSLVRGARCRRTGA
jgi:hypothetical protein